MEFEFGHIKDVTGKIVKSGDTIEIGNFYDDTFNTEDMFGTDPENSWMEREAYPERIKQKVFFYGGCMCIELKYRNGRVFYNPIMSQILDAKNGLDGFIFTTEESERNQELENWEDFKDFEAVYNYLDYIKILD